MKAAALLALLLPFAAPAQEQARDWNQEEFTALDLNGDGKVSLAEAAGHAAVVVRFDRADRNRDGKLTLAEFSRLKTLKIPVDRKARAAQEARAARSAGVGASGRRGSAR